MLHNEAVRELDLLKMQVEECQQKLARLQSQQQGCNMHLVNRLDGIEERRAAAEKRAAAAEERAAARNKRGAVTAQRFRDHNPFLSRDYDKKFQADIERAIKQSLEDKIDIDHRLCKSDEPFHQVWPNYFGNSCHTQALIVALAYFMKFFPIPLRQDSEDVGERELCNAIFNLQNGSRCFGQANMGRLRKYLNAGIMWNHVGFASPYACADMQKVRDDLQAGIEEEVIWGWDDTCSIWETLMTRDWFENAFLQVASHNCDMSLNHLRHAERYKVYGGGVSEHDAQLVAASVQTRKENLEPGIHFYAIVLHEGSWYKVDGLEVEKMHPSAAKFELDNYSAVQFFI